jgi:DNA-binding NarL/FixJ family response regulator
LDQTKILLVDMPRMLRDIVRAVAAQDPALQIVGEVSWETDLTATAYLYDAAVIVAGARAKSRSEIGELLEARPRTRVLTIAADGAQSILYRLSPEAVALGDLSPARLLEAIHG